MKCSVISLHCSALRRCATSSWCLLGNWSWASWASLRSPVIWSVVLHRTGSLWKYEKEDGVKNKSVLQYFKVRQKPGDRIKSMVLPCVCRKKTKLCAGAPVKCLQDYLPTPSICGFPALKEARNPLPPVASSVTISSIMVLEVEMRAPGLKVPQNRPNFCTRRVWPL